VTKRTVRTVQCKPTGCAYCVLGGKNKHCEYLLSPSKGCGTHATFRQIQDLAEVDGLVI